MPSFTRKLSDMIQEGFPFGLTQEDYPIFDESYRDHLNTKILKHYWNYEIGQETESMFRFMLNRKMNEVMPYYNQLYLSERIQFDPLQTMNFTDFFTSSNTNNNIANQTGNSESDTRGKSRSVNSNTPQVQLSGNEDYASNAADVNSESDVSSTSTNASNATDTQHGTAEKTIQGSSGLPSSDLLMRYRATFLNIDMHVIKELETLFMQLWDNGDEYSHSEGPGYGYFGSFGIL
jgi:hypothetical protein